jgi:serine protease Do
MLAQRLSPAQYQLQNCRQASAKREENMNSLLALIFAGLAMVPVLSGKTFARGAGAGDFTVAQTATPAVVNIALWKVRPPTKVDDPPRRVRTYGSGFVIDPSGIIVTNRHVIDGATSIQVILSNGDQLKGELVGAAPMLDVAVVKVHVDHPLPALQWGDSKALRVGDPVLTIGNPLGLGMSVSAGIVSALNRDIEDTPYDNYIQTDSAINHGNSGGPMVDLNGEVVGVDTALYNPDEAGGFIGIGFAIPAEFAKVVVDRLLDPSHPKPGWLGVTLQDLTRELSLALGVGGAKGAIIAAVDDSGPAHAAGLKPSDVLLAIDGLRLNDSRAYLRTIVQIPVGRQTTLSVWRAGKEQAIAANVAEWPNSMWVMSASMAEKMNKMMPDSGLRFAQLTDETRMQYRIEGKVKGALISSVEKDSEAADLGIVPGDVVTLVQDIPVAAPDEIRDVATKAYGGGSRFLAVLIQNTKGARWVSLSLGKSEP